MRPYHSTTVETRLTEKQKVFCQEYLVDLNATRAAARAGYRTPRRQGSNLIGLPNVQIEVRRLMDERARRTGITADQVLQELVMIARVNPADAFSEDGRILPPREMPEEIQRAIATLEVREIYDRRGPNRVATGQAKRLRFWDKIRALELLGKHLGLFSEKLEVTGRDQGPVVVQQMMSAEQSEELDAYLADLRAGLVPPGTAG